MVKGVVGDLESFFRPSVASVFTFCTENSRATVGKSWKRMHGKVLITNPLKRVRTNVNLLFILVETSKR